MINQVEIPQVQHSSYCTSSCRSITPVSTWSHGSDALKKTRPENEQVPRGQGAEDCEIGRDEHHERKGGWNSRSEATGAARESTRPSTRPRDGDVREQRPDAALDVLGAACTSMGDNKTRVHQTCGPVNQHKHVCVERCPGHEAHSQAQRRQLRRVATTELRRECTQRPKRNRRRMVASELQSGTRGTRSQSCSSRRGRRECESWSTQALETPPRTEPAGRERRVVLVSPADHAQHAIVRAEEQRVSEQ